MTTNRRIQFIAALMTGCSLSTLAQAAIDELTVTAQFREQSIQDVPISISAFSSENLRDANIHDYKDLVLAMPGVEMSNFSLSNPGISIRGISGENLDVASEPAVALYVDGVYRKRAVHQLMDLERVEVLKGPQGTLYGRNTTAGVLNFITKKPGDTFEGSAEVEVGNYETLNVRGYVSGPITDKLAAKFNASLMKNEPYTNSIVPGIENDDRESKEFRGTVVFTPTENAELTLSADYVDDDTPGTPVVPVKTETIEYGGMSMGLPVVNQVVLFDPTSSDPDLNPTGRVATDFWDSMSDIEESDDRDEWGLSLTGEFDLGFANLTSITAYRDFEQKVISDVDGTPCVLPSVFFIGEFFLDSLGFGDVPDVKCYAQGDPVLTGLGLTGTQWTGDNEITSDQFTQEVRLTSTSGGAFTFDDRLQWTLGAFYYKEESQQVRQTGVNGNPLAHKFENDLDLEAWAIYGQGTFAITDRINVTLGARYTHEEKEYIIAAESYPVIAPHPFIPFATETLFDSQPAFDFGNFPAGTFQTPLAGGPPTEPAPMDAVCTLNTRCIPQTNVGDSYNSLDPRLTVDFQVTDNMMLYATYQLGFKSGGFNASPVSLSVGVDPYDAEEVKAYEVGMKSDWFDGRLRLNAVAFHYDYENEQIFGNFDHDNDPDTPTALIFRNAKESTKEGGEIDILAEVTDRLTINAGYAYTDATFGDFPVFFGPVEINNFKGNTALRAPKHSANIGIQYTLPMANDGNLTFRLDGSYKSKQFFVAENLDQNIQKSYDVWNASVSYEPNEQWRFSLWGKNLFEEEYYTQKFQAGAAELFLAPGAVANPGVYDAGRERATPGLPRRFGITATYRFGG